MPETSGSRRLFGIDRPLIAMLHLPPCPGVEGYLGVAASLKFLRRDLQACLAGKADALLLENMHDFPCVGEDAMGPEVAAYLTRMALAARELADTAAGGSARPLPMGIQVLFAANRTALAVAQATGLQFIRAEAWTHAHVSDKGLIDAQGGLIKRYQKRIEAGEVKIFTDIKKKHASHSLTADLDLGEIAALLELHRSDGAIVTGRVTGEEPLSADLETVRARTELPMIVGSGIDVENIADFFPLADAFIVGSSLKETGAWDAPVDAVRVRAIMDRVRELRRAGGD